MMQLITGCLKKNLIHMASAELSVDGLKAIYQTGINVWLFALLFLNGNQSI